MLQEVCGFTVMSPQLCTKSTTAERAGPRLTDSADGGEEVKTRSKQSLSAAAAPPISVKPTITPSSGTAARSAHGTSPRTTASVMARQPWGSSWFGPCSSPSHQEICWPMKDNHGLDPPIHRLIFGFFNILGIKMANRRQ